MVGVYVLISLAPPTDDVRPWNGKTCSTNKNYHDQVVYRSPNKNNRGGQYYCVVGTCRAQGDAYWDYNGRNGGP